MSLIMEFWALAKLGVLTELDLESRPILNRVRIGLTILNRVLIRNSESDSESRPILNRAYDPIIRKIDDRAQFPIRLWARTSYFTIFTFLHTWHPNRKNVVGAPFSLIAFKRPQIVVVQSMIDFGVVNCIQLDSPMEQTIVVVYCGLLLACTDLRIHFKSYFIKMRQIWRREKKAICFLYMKTITCESWNMKKKQLSKIYSRFLWPTKLLLHDVKSAGKNGIIQNWTTTRKV